jgi:uncharacterized protein YndB with AHSA1/START domain
MPIIGTLKVTTPTDCEIVMTRIFSAPRRLVWDAMTNREFLTRWLLGPPGWSMTVCENELEVGGTFRWAWRGPDGQDMVMRGVNHEVVRLERIVRTETFELGCNAQPADQLATLVLAEHDEGRGEQTALSLTLLYPSKGARDAAVASGMEHGVALGYDRLDQLLATTSARGTSVDAA